MCLSYLSNSPLSASVAHAVHVMNISAYFASSGRQVVVPEEYMPVDISELYARHGVPPMFEVNGVETPSIGRLGVIYIGSDARRTHMEIVAVAGYQKNYTWQARSRRVHEGSQR